MFSSGALGTVLLLLAVLAPAAGAVLGRLARGRSRDRLLLAGAAGGAVAAAILPAWVAGSGPAVAAAGIHGLQAGRVQAVLLAVVTLVGLLVIAFAGRYLSGDPRRSRFFLLSGLTVSATGAMVAAASLSGLVVAWVASGAGLAALLAHQRDLPAARAATRRTVLAFSVGDTALVLALGLVLASGGDVGLGDPSAAAATLAAREIAGLPVVALVAGLAVLAAMARSAQVPFSTWLAGTVAAPTPVSALLHAGVVNGGGILLVTLSPLLVRAPAAVGLAFAAGAVTALVGTARMLARPDVKGALVQSTSSQMGFMMLQASMGALSAAVFHIAAHAMYKASAFLGSGAVIQRRERARLAPPPAPRRGGALGRGLIAAGAAAALVAGATSALAPAIASRPGGLVLLAFAWLTSAQAAFAWLQRRPAPLSAGAFGGVALLAVPVSAYVGLLGLLEEYLAPALPAAGAAGWAPQWLALPVLALFGAGLVLRWAAEHGVLDPARRDSPLYLSLYAAARRAGEAPLAPERSRA